MKRHRGISLPVVLALIMIVAAIAMMVISQGQSVRTLVLGEGRHFDQQQASLHGKTRLRKDLERWSTSSRRPGDQSYLPSNGRISADIRWKGVISGTSQYLPPAKNYASFDNLFPNWSKDHFTPGNLDKGKWPRAGYTNDTEDGRPIIDGVPVPANHTLAAFEIEGNNKKVLYNPLFPYSAYAPEGSIDIEVALSHNNPRYSAPVGDSGLAPVVKNPPLNDFNGKPVRMFAKNQVEVDRVEWAKIDSQQGPILVRDGLALSRVRSSIKHRYPELISTQLEAAMADLQTRGSDKTGLIRGRPLTVSGLIQMFRGTADWYSLLSLEQSMQIPFPIIPSLKEYGPLQVLCLNVPLPSDWTGFQYSEADAKKLAKLSDDLTAATKRVEPLKVELEKQNKLLQELKDSVEKIKERTDDPDDRELKEALANWRKQKKKVSETQSKLDDAQSDADRLAEELNAALKESKDHFDNHTSRDFGPPPQTQRQDEEYVRRKGYFGWSFFRLVSTVVTNIEELFDVFFQNNTAQIPDEIADQFVFPSRLLHFAGRRPELWTTDTKQLRSDLLTFDRPASAPLNYNSFKATWSIQPGTSAKLRGDWQIDGDLWLRRGALLVVTGDLLVSSPLTWPAIEVSEYGQGISFDYEDKEATGPMRPTGRIILEEGATLVVEGNLKVEGNRRLGSITATAAYGDPGLINRSILCKGDVELMHGIHGGILMDDMLRDLGPFGEEVYGGLDQFLNRLAPFLSRAPVISAFGWRDSYFAQYATTIEIVEILDVPVPLPIPLPYENCLRDPFDYLSIAFSINLGYQLGPKFMTHSLVWPWGNGVVPAIVKVEPSILKEAVKDFQPPTAFMEAVNADEIAKSILHAVENAGETFLKEFVGSLLTKILGNEGFKCGGGSKEVKEASKSAFKTILQHRTQLLAFIKLGIGHYSEASEKALEAWQDQVEQGSERIKEIPGVLVYSGGNLKVGSTHASGWLVAGEDLTVDADVFLGTLMSLRGNIKAKTVYAFPYYSQASVYRAPKDKTTAWAELIQFEIPKGVDTPLDIGYPVYHSTAEVWDHS